MFPVSRFALPLAGLTIIATLSGCAGKQRPELIPPTARLQMSGDGRQLYTAPSDGFVYLYDKPADYLIWSGQVRGGETILVDREKDQIRVNSTIVSNDIPVRSGRAIDILFEPRPLLNSSAQESSARIGGPFVNTNGNGATVTTPGSVTVTPPPVTVTPSVTVEPREPVPPAPRP
jgi:hypothetical protein